jgi:hypothetical protein
MSRRDLENALDELRRIEREAIELLPQSDGGDTGALARQGVEAIEILLAAGYPKESAIEVED